MRKILFTLLIFTSFISQAQITNSLEFNKAKRLMSLDSYQEALPILTKLKTSIPGNYNLDYLIGTCYLNQVYDKNKAIPFLETAVKHIDKTYKNNIKTASAPEKSLYYLSKSYLLDYQLDLCIKTADILINDSENAELIALAKQIKFNAENGKTLMVNPIKIKIKALEINSKQDDYTALINADETQMIFTSRREGSTGGLKNDEGKYYEDIYISYKKDNKWSTPENIGENINTDRNDACVTLSPDGMSLIIFRDDYGIGNLYISHKDSSGWSKAVKLSKNINSNSNETHAAFSHDGQKIYFISNIKDGFGGKDIYFSNKLPNGEWSFPQNIGDKINTKFDEEGVYVHPDGQKLYFSSKGHNSMGGFDIFYCNLIGDSVWSAPKNIGYPINTTDNDVFAVFSSDNKRAYYAANKKEGMGAYDIYQIDLMSLPERNNTIIKGYLRAADHSILKNKSIKVTNSKGHTIGKYKCSTDGLFTIVLQQKQSYKINVSGLELVNNTLDVPNNSAFYITQKALIIDTIAQSK